MDINSIIIGAIVIACCIVPFVIMEQNRKIKERRIIQSLINFANQHNCNINKHEICGDFIIGIDETKKIVFFLKILKDKVVEQYINLAEIRTCKVTNSSRTVAHQSVIDRLELNFIPIDKNKKEITFEFFNSDIKMQLDREFDSIEKWAKQINAYL